MNTHICVYVYVYMYIYVYVYIQTHTYTYISKCVMYESQKPALRFHSADFQLECYAGLGGQGVGFLKGFGVGLLFQHKVQGHLGCRLGLSISRYCMS